MKEYLNSEICSKCGGRCCLRMPGCYTPNDITIVASGTSCRHQIKDGTGKTAYHPIEIMWEAVK